MPATDHPEIQGSNTFARLASNLGLSLREGGDLDPDAAVPIPRARERTVEHKAAQGEGGR